MRLHTPSTRNWTTLHLELYSYSAEHNTNTGPHARSPRALHQRIYRQRRLPGEGEKIKSKKRPPKVTLLLFRTTAAAAWDGNVRCERVRYSSLMLRMHHILNHLCLILVYKFTGILVLPPKKQKQTRRGLGCPAGTVPVLEKAYLLHMICLGLPHHIMALFVDTLVRSE